MSAPAISSLPAAQQGRVCQGAKPRTARQQAGRPARPPARSQRRSHLQCRAAAATAQQLEGVQSWLAAAGVYLSKLAAAPSPSGLVCSRAVARGEQIFAIPDSAWITAATAEESDIGSHLAG
jgi:hypothetical protein